MRGAQEDGADLAIIIPAFKPDYLAAALQSIASQSTRGFRVYVGDDASPHDLRTICERFSSQFSLTYWRFESNLGGSSLVQQWQRCIALSVDEPWLWLFSDDDVMDATCVSAWREAREAAPNASVFHFDVVRIDAAGAVLKHEPGFPDLLSSREFALRRFRTQLMSYAPDYIFRRTAMDSAGGIPEFPLAWCSDDAAWVAFSWPHGIHAVRGAHLHWRFSGANITSQGGHTIQRKVQAAVGYLEWMERFLCAHAAENGEPADDEIIRAGRYWFYNHAANLGYPFFAGASWAKLIFRVGRLRGHGVLKTALRMLQADFQRQTRRN
jgi:glycosyltransferase involved in cell wall biosynthesis